MASNIILRPSYWASVSGGKDSLYMLMLILSKPDKYPLDGVVHFELEIDFPFIKDVVALMEEKCQALGIPFVRIRPTRSWYDLLEEQGTPGRVKRWCNSKYKLDANKQLKNFLKTKGKELIIYIGFCADEVKRFKDDKNIYPLAEEGITEDFILDWAKNELIFNDYYKYNTRCGCMYCPLASMPNMAYMAVYYPKEFEWWMETCKQGEREISEKLGRKYSIWNGHCNGKYDTEYRLKRLKEKYIPELLAEIEREKFLQSISDGGSEVEE